MVLANPRDSTIYLMLPVAACFKRTGACCVPTK